MPSPSQTPGKPPTSIPFLNRYTALPILLDVLHNRHITLLSPETWEDRNDAYYLQRYQLKAKSAAYWRSAFHWRKRHFTTGGYSRTALLVSASNLINTRFCSILFLKQNFDINKWSIAGSAI